MPLSFAIWDLETSNVLGTYASERDALDAVRGLLTANGGDLAADLALIREDARGLPEAIDSGNSLAVRALLASHALPDAEATASPSEAARWSTYVWHFARRSPTVANVVTSSARTTTYGSATTSHAIAESEAHYESEERATGRRHPQLARAA
jgi:hypothetical protein